MTSRDCGRRVGGAELLLLWLDKPPLGNTDRPTDRQMHLCLAAVKVNPELSENRYTCCSAFRHQVFTGGHQRDDSCLNMEARSRGSDCILGIYGDIKPLLGFPPNKVVAHR